MNHICCQCMPCNKVYWYDEHTSVVILSINNPYWAYDFPVPCVNCLSYWEMPWRVQTMLSTLEIFLLL